MLVQVDVFVSGDWRQIRAPGFRTASEALIFEPHLAAVPHSQ
jgi:hypothetical protein